MAGTTTVYKNSKVYSSGYDLSGALNEFSLSYEFEEKESVHLGDECRYSVPGLPKLAFDLKGHAYSNDNPAEIEDILMGKLAVVDGPMVWSPLTGAVAEAAYFAETLPLSYSPGAAVGELYAFTCSGVGQGSKLVRGTIMETGVKTTTADGTARQLGAVAAGKKLYGCLQVLEVSGTDPTLDVIVASDDAQLFGDPVTRLTFTQRTALGAQFITPVAGPITDTWWRVSWAIGGTDDPSFKFLVVVGIL